MQLGPRHPDLGRALADRGEILRDLRRLAEARRALDEAAVILTPVRNEEYHVLRTFQGRLAMDEGRYSEAESHFAEAEKLRKATGGDKLPYYWMDRSVRGSAIARQGRVREAEALQRESLRALAGLVGEGAWTWRIAAEELAATLRLAGRASEADALERPGARGRQSLPVARTLATPWRAFSRFSECRDDRRMSRLVTKGASTCPLGCGPSFIAGAPSASSSSSRPPRPRRPATTIPAWSRPSTASAATCSVRPPSTPCWRARLTPSSRRGCASSSPRNRPAWWRSSSRPRPAKSTRRNRCGPSSAWWCAARRSRSNTTATPPAAPCR